MGTRREALEKERALRPSVETSLVEILEYHSDDLPGEAWFRAKMREYLNALQEMRLDEAIPPKLMDAIQGRNSWEEFREYLRELEQKRRSE